MTYLDIIDSAVKIGLGALIAGLSTLALSRSQFHRDLEKERIKREFEMLKQVAEQVESQTHVALRYWALITEWARYQRLPQEMPESREKELNNCKVALFDGFKDMTSAESKLLLLGLSSAQKSLRVYGETMTELRRQLNRGAEPATELQAQEWRSKILSCRETFFTDLSNCYRQLSKKQ